MQSVYNRGECMMHVDKNADDHIVDMDRISREIAYVPFNGRIMSTRHAYQWSDGFEVLDASQRSDGFEIWTCFPEV